MSTSLRISLFLLALLFLVLVLGLLRKKRFNLKYSLLWLFLAVVLMLLSLFPEIVSVAAGLLGIATPVNAVFLCVIAVLIMILVSLTTAITKLEKKQKALIQLVGILENEMNTLEAKLQNGNPPKIENTPINPENRNNPKGKPL